LALLEDLTAASHPSRLGFASSSVRNEVADSVSLERGILRQELESAWKRFPGNSIEVDPNLVCLTCCPSVMGTSLQTASRMA